MLTHLNMLGYLSYCFAPALLPSIIFRCGHLDIYPDR